MKHLTLNQRYKIQALLELNFTKSQIARQVGVDKSCITRELQRNCLDENNYDAFIAHKLYTEAKRKAGRITKKFNACIKKEVDKRLKLQFSPEQIEGQLDRLGLEKVSHTTIYKYIWRDKDQDGLLYMNLRSSKKKRRKKYGSGKDNRGIIPNRVSIEKRPKIVDKMSRIGDWEADIIVGKDHKGFMVSLTERRSMFQLIRKVKSKKAEVVEKAIVKMIRDSKLPAYTMTFDNGKEFTNHENIAKALNLKAFFAHPYSSFERGLNENQNGLVRQYFPKKTDFRSISQQQVRKVQKLLNIRPRKSIWFFSPEELIERELQLELKT